MPNGGGCGGRDEGCQVRIATRVGVKQWQWWWRVLDNGEDCQVVVVEDVKCRWRC